MKYFGLTDDSERCRLGLGNPEDFRVIVTFKNRRSSQLWVELMLKEGFKETPAREKCSGWKHGYIY